MPALYIPHSTYAFDKRLAGVLLHRDDARLPTEPEAVEGFSNAL
jgi:hypothetical protein